MKSLSIFILLLASVFSAVSQESEEEYQNEEEYDNEDDYDNEEGEEEERTYFDFDKYFNFNNDQYSNILDKVNEMNPEEEEVLYKFIVDIQQDKVLKDRLFRELVSKVKKKSRYEGKDSPGFNCIVLGLMENKTVYDAIIKDGRTEDQARNAAALSERSARRTCGIAKKKVDKVPEQQEEEYEEEEEYDDEDDYDNEEEQ